MADRMPLREALAVLAGARRGEAVISSMGSAREWPALSDHPLDLHYVPSTMGGAIPLALGVALGQPQRDVWALAGDGSLLMNLGGLVTVAASGATNLSIVLLDNGVYEVTGGQTTPAAVAGADYVGLARAAGFPTAVGFRQLADWRQAASAALAEPGPRFISLAVHPVRAQYQLAPPAAMHEQLSRFSQALHARL